MLLPVLHTHTVCRTRGERHLACQNLITPKFITMKFTANTSSNARQSKHIMLSGSIPVASIVVGNGQFPAHDHVVDEDAFAHGPQLKPNCADGEQVVKWRFLFKISRVGNFSRGPFPLQE